MKKTILAVFVIALMVSCKQEKADYTVISGKITNPISTSLPILRFPYGKQVASIQLKRDGTFKDTLRIENGYYAIYRQGIRALLYIEKGFDFSMIHESKDKGLIFSGKGAKANNYLLKKMEIIKKFSKNAISDLSEKEFLAEKDSLKKNLERELKKVGGNFEKVEQKTLKYEYAYDLLRYIKTNGSEYAKSENFIKTLKEIDFNNDKEFNENYSYRKLVILHFKKSVLTETVKRVSPKKIFFERDKIYLEKVKAIKAGNIKSGLVAELLNKVGISPYSKEIYEAIMKFSKDETVKKKAEEKWKKVQTLSKGNPSPTFENYENYQGGKTSLKDFKGKYVYIDVWATWCGPCKRQIPFMKKIEKKYHGKDIVFVSISVDELKNKEAWKKMIKEKGMVGVQLFADKGWESEFVQGYGIRGIPRFIFLDRKGKIISANAPRPSDPRLIELFKEYGL